MDTKPLVVVEAWQNAAGRGDVEALLDLCSPDIEIVGPRGSGRGHDLLRAWMGSARVSLTTLRRFARGDVAVVAQHGVWHSLETDELIGEADVASRFRIDGPRVAEYARFDTLDDALAAAGLSYEDEVT